MRFLFTGFFSRSFTRFFPNAFELPSRIHAILSCFAWWHDLIQENIILANIPIVTQMMFDMFWILPTLRITQLWRELAQTNFRDVCTSLKERKRGKKKKKKLVRYRFMKHEEGSKNHIRRHLTVFRALKGDSTTVIKEVKFCSTKVTIWLNYQDLLVHFSLQVMNL